jgi:hypothetical protein
MRCFEAARARSAIAARRSTTECILSMALATGDWARAIDTNVIKMASTTINFRFAFLPDILFT